MINAYICDLYPTRHECSISSSSRSIQMAEHVTSIDTIVIKIMVSEGNLRFKVYTIPTNHTKWTDIHHTAQLQEYFDLLILFLHT
jgi:hypothetical protein